MFFMDVYDIDESGKLTKFEHKSIPRENIIDDFIESHPEIIEPDLKIIGRQVETDTGKFVDLMGIDKDANVVIIEDKKGRMPRDVVAQIIDYAVWAETRNSDQLNAIAKKNEKLEGHKTLEKMFEDWAGDDAPDWNENQKLYVIGEDIDDETKNMISYLNKKGIQLYAKIIKLHEGQDGKQKLTVFPVVVGKEKRKERKENATVRTEQDHINKGNSNVGKIYEIIKQQTLDLDDSIDLNVVKNYIGFRTNWGKKGGRNWFWIKFRQDRLRIIFFAGIDGNGLDDPENMTENHSEKSCRMIQNFSDKEKIPELMKLIKRSFELANLGSSRKS